MPTQPDSLPDLIEMFRAYCAAHAPGETPQDLRVVFASGRRLQHPFPPPCSAGPKQLPPARHSPDFRSVHWHGDDYAFSPTQAAVVRVLWEAWEGGVPDVGQVTLLEAAGSDSERLRSVFTGHPAWAVLIVAGTSKGSYRLATA